MYHREAVLKNAHMPEKMQRHLVESMTQVLEKYNIEKAVAAHTQKFEKCNPVCPCIARGNFGSHVTHETKHVIHLTWARWSCFGSSLVKGKDCVTHPGICPKTRTKAHLSNTRD